MRKCPFCAENIQDEAIKCRFCNEFLDGRKPVVDAVPWYRKPMMIVMALFTLGPLALPLVWFKKEWSIFIRLLITVVVLIVTLLLSMIIQQALTGLNEQLKMLGIG